MGVSPSAAGDESPRMVNKGRSARRSLQNGASGCFPRWRKTRSKGGGSRGAPVGVGGGWERRAVLPLEGN